MKEEDGTDLPARLAAPARRALFQAGISRLEQLAELREAQIRGLHGIGLNAIEVLRKAVVERELLFHE